MDVYEVTAAEDAPSERLVVSVAGKTLVFGEALDTDREAEGVYIASEADAPLAGDADLASELALLSERIPEVAAVVNVEHIPAPVEDTVVVEEVVEVTPVDPPDTVVGAGETTPHIERETLEDATAEVDAENEGLPARDLDDDGSKQ